MTTSIRNEVLASEINLKHIKGKGVGKLYVSNWVIVNNKITR